MRITALILLIVCVNAMAVTPEQFNKLKNDAQVGDASAQFCLGMIYDEGEGVAVDKVEAVRWYRKSAEQGYIKAQNNLSSAYYTGEGVKKDLVEAVRWCRKAAEQGDIKAQNTLGGLYAMGDGVLKDTVEAYAYFNLSAITNEDARKNRSIIEKDMSPSQIEAGQKRSRELQKEIDANISKKAGK